jgi:hypothetical protein
MKPLMGRKVNIVEKEKGREAGARFWNKGSYSGHITQPTSSV